MTLDDLAALADRATPGPWKSIRCETPGYRHMAFSRKRDEPYTIGPALPADTAYLAACSPEVIKALVAVAESLPKDDKMDGQWCRWCGRHDKDHDYCSWEVTRAALDTLRAVMA
jgi:hypothetical protein